ncbi:cysteine hydrolase family protein [Planomicrobium sp. CPCC 101079]|uniref:cysteine hydrolase family protein n=1 Tax=Planomicrobium sp. CPCC 101079 TaxID=2599618 RepID=UPI0011B45335|nr:cysteine hydrolase family protein [Planomicrobium sp. CPCC 101079]TWT13499.1 cysteine hydrolase [Planomicrobium sp. CPCC 101079]
MKQALLIIDAQQELIDGNQNEPGVTAKEELIETINKVIEKALTLSIPIVFIRDLDVSDGAGPGFQVHSSIKMPEEATIFDKKATNAFYETPLLGYLQQHEVQLIVIMGCKTEYCIDTAVRTATTNKFDVTLVSDGHSTTTSVVLPAEKIIAHHNKTLHGFDNVDHFSLVRESLEDIFTPIHNNYR